MANKPEPEMTPKTAELFAQFQLLQHAMQSGVKYDLQSGGKDSPKHLRVGVNSALTEISALARLLVCKGVFTYEEYAQALVDGMLEEVRRYESDLSARFKMEIKLL